MITLIEKDVETLPTAAERKFCGKSLLTGSSLPLHPWTHALIQSHKCYGYIGSVSNLCLNGVFSESCLEH